MYIKFFCFSHRKSLWRKIGACVLIWRHLVRFAIWQCQPLRLYWNGLKLLLSLSPLFACYCVSQARFGILSCIDQIYTPHQHFVNAFFLYIVLGLEQGLENYKPSRFYIFITLSYYILTEKLIQDALPNFLFYMPHWLTHDRLVGLEELYSGLILKSVTIGANVLMLVPSFYSIKLVLCTLYLNVYLQYKAWKHVKSRLEEEFQLVSHFRVASQEDLSTLDDVCAICLSPMEHARVTPCQHVFHTTCLRLCLKNLNNNMCPICKRELKLDWFNSYYICNSHYYCAFYIFTYWLTDL